MTREQMRQVVAQWADAGPELRRVRDEALASRPYDWRLVDALLDMGVRYRRPQRDCGLILMQARLTEIARLRGSPPPGHHDDPGALDRES